MTSPVDVVNQALSQMGARSRVTSINPSDGSPAGDAASLLYQTQFNATARAAHWNCLRYQKALTVLKAAQGTPENPTGSNPLPPIPWIYEYALPPDCLAARMVIPQPQQTGVSPPLTTGGIPVNSFVPYTTAMPFVPAVDFDTSDVPAQVRVLLTNAPTAVLVYTAQVDNPDLWDASFLNAFIAVLAAWLVNPLNMDQSLLAQRVSVAQGLIMQARISDGNEGVASTDSVPDWIRSRWQSAGLRLGPEGPYQASWQPIVFPNGISY